MPSRNYGLGGAIVAATALHLVPWLPTTPIGQKARAEILHVLHANGGPVSTAPVTTPSKVRDEIKLRTASVQPLPGIEVSDQEKIAEIDRFRRSIRFNDGSFSDHVFTLYLYSQAITPERRARVGHIKMKYHQWRHELIAMLNQGVPIHIALPQVTAKIKYESGLADLGEAIELERGNCEMATLLSTMLLADVGFTANLYLRFEAANPFTNQGHVAPIFKYSDGSQWDIMEGDRSSRLGVTVPVSYLPDLYAVQHDLPAHRRSHRLTKTEGQQLYGSVVVPSYRYSREGSLYYRGALISPFDPTSVIETGHTPVIGSEYEATYTLFGERFLRPFTPPVVREGIDLPRTDDQQGLVFFETPPLTPSSVVSIPMTPLPARVAGFAPSEELTHLDTLAAREVSRLTHERNGNKRLVIVARIVGLYRQIEDVIRINGYQDTDHQNMATYAHTRAQTYHAEGMRLLDTLRNAQQIPDLEDMHDLVYLGNEGIAFITKLQSDCLNRYPDFFQLDGGASEHGRSMRTYVNIGVTLLFNSSTRDAQLATISGLPFASQVALSRHIVLDSVLATRQRTHPLPALLSDSREPFARIVLAHQALADYYYLNRENNSDVINEDYNFIRNKVTEIVRQYGLPEETIELFMASLIEDRMFYGITNLPTVIPPPALRRQIVNTIQTWGATDSDLRNGANYIVRIHQLATVLLSSHQGMLEAWYNCPFRSNQTSGSAIDLRPYPIPGYQALRDHGQALMRQFNAEYFGTD